MNAPLISICIPSYERTEFLPRLLESIRLQNFRNFEVIFTDDSKTTAVKDFLDGYKADFPLVYVKNIPSLGTSRNMVEGLKYARANWIKMIHDDDFFADENSLAICAEYCTGDSQYVFSGYNEYFEETGKLNNKTISQKQFQHITKTPSEIFAANLIGPPSVMMVRKDITVFFDSRLKWHTDMEYYYTILGKVKALYINKPLVNVSYNASQITNYTRMNPSVVVAEAIYLLNKHGSGITANIWAYDSWWREMRNMGINTVKELEQYAGDQPVPPVAKTMVKHLHRIPPGLLQFRPLSKIFMFLSYLFNPFR